MAKTPGGLICRNFTREGAAVSRRASVRIGTPPGGYRADFRVAKCENPGGPGARRPRVTLSHGRPAGTARGPGGAKTQSVSPGRAGKPRARGREPQGVPGRKRRDPGPRRNQGRRQAGGESPKTGLGSGRKSPETGAAAGENPEKPSPAGLKTPARGGPPRRKTRKTPGARGKKPGKPRETVSARDGFARPHAYAYARTCTRRRARRPAGAFCACI